MASIGYCGPLPLCARVCLKYLKGFHWQVFVVGNLKSQISYAGHLLGSDMTETHSLVEYNLPWLTLLSVVDH